MLQKLFSLLLSVMRLMKRTMVQLYWCTMRVSRWTVRMVCGFAAIKQYQSKRVHRIERDGDKKTKQSKEERTTQSSKENGNDDLAASPEIAASELGVAKVIDEFVIWPEKNSPLLDNDKVQLSSIVDEDYCYDWDDCDDSTIVCSEITVIDSKSDSSTLIPSSGKTSDVADLEDFLEYKDEVIEKLEVREVPKITFSSENRLTVIQEDVIYSVEADKAETTYQQWASLEVGRLYIDPMVSSSSAINPEVVVSDLGVTKVIDEYVICLETNSPLLDNKVQLLSIVHEEYCYDCDVSTIVCSEITVIDSKSDSSTLIPSSGRTNDVANLEDFLESEGEKIEITTMQEKVTFCDAVDNAEMTVTDIDSGIVSVQEQRSLRQRLIRWHRNNIRNIKNLFTACTSEQTAD